MALPGNLGREALPAEYPVSMEIVLSLHRCASANLKPPNAQVRNPPDRRRTWVGASGSMTMRSKKMRTMRGNGKASFRSLYRAPECRNADAEGEKEANLSSCKSALVATKRMALSAETTQRPRRQPRSRFAPEAHS